MKNKLTIGGIILGSMIMTGCALRPYVPDIQQGNVLTKQQINQIKFGLSKQQVRAILGKSILENTLNDNNWSYVYTKQVNGGKIVKRSLHLTFKNNKLYTIDNNYKADGKKS